MGNTVGSREKRGENHGQENEEIRGKWGAKVEQGGHNDPLTKETHGSVEYRE